MSEGSASGSYQAFDYLLYLDFYSVFDSALIMILIIMLQNTGSSSSQSIDRQLKDIEVLLLIKLVFHG
jgi:hypothetical protein